MKTTLLRCESRQGFLVCGHASILMLAVTQFLPTALTHELLGNREQLFCNITAQILQLLTERINAECRGYMLRQVAFFVVKGMCEFLWTACQTNDHHALPHSLVGVGQASIKMAGAKIPDCLPVFVSRAAESLQLRQNLIRPIPGHSIIDSAMPIVLRQVYVLHYHNYMMSSQGIGIPLPSILAIHILKMFSGLSSTSSMMALICLTICCSSSMDSFQ